MKKIIQFRMLTAFAGLLAVALPLQQAVAAQVITTDLIVQGSECIGFDCFTSESFGSDTLRLKENNLRIHFNDTSASASFPGNDWRITINDSTNGGANYFRVEDVDGGKSPFTIEAGASTNALYVEDDGEIGIGTATPVVEVHVTDGDSPTLRLEQDGSSGFQAQTWDLAGNETNFFIRDVTNGSLLPFRIKPGAPKNSLFIEATGSIGLGTENPAALLDIDSKGTSETGLRVVGDTGTNTSMVLERNGLSWTANVTSGGAVYNLLDPSGVGLQIANTGSFAVQLAPGNPLFSVSSNGNGTFTGFVSATSFVAGGTTLNVPDYVFKDDYRLMPIEELAAFIEEKNHLPNVPSAAEIEEKGSVDLAQLQMTLLEKIEELTLYTVQQEEKIGKLQARLSEMEKAQ